MVGAGWCMGGARWCMGVHGGCTVVYGGVRWCMVEGLRSRDLRTQGLRIQGPKGPKGLKE